MSSLCQEEEWLSLGGKPTSTYACGVCPLRIIFQHSGQAEIRHFALQVVVNQDVACCQVPVNITHVREVLHASCNSTQHAHQLEGGKLSIVVLEEDSGAVLIPNYVIPPLSSCYMISCLNVREGNNRWTHPKIFVQCSILHVFSHYHSMFNCKKKTVTSTKLQMMLKDKTRLTTGMPTFSDHTLQTNDVLMGELAHDGGLAQEILPLLLRVSRFQCLDSYWKLLLPWNL